MKTLQNYKEGFTTPPQGFVYDPGIKGYDNSFWADVTGTPSLNAGAIRLNNAVMASFIQFTIGKLFLNVALPAVPTAGDQRFIGFNFSDAPVGIGFDFVDDTVTAVIATQSGLTYSKVLDPALFTVARHDFNIDWNEGSVAFYLDGVCLAVCEDKNICRELKGVVLPLYVENLTADNLDVFVVGVTEAGRIN
jgi:hypothetical protein